MALPYGIVALPPQYVSPIPSILFGGTFPGQPSGILLQFPPIFPFLLGAQPSGITII